MSSLRIEYEAESFPPGTIANGIAELTVSWDDLLWAAMTVGRPNRQYVFRHGDASAYEAVFRLSLVRMALEQTSSGSYRLRRTEAAKTLDPTEKGAVSYFLGMTFCKLFAAKLLNTPWLLHLDVCRPLLNPVLTGRSRPDLVGKERRSSRWHGFECKGRISLPASIVKSKAKYQAERLESVNGTECVLHIAAITYFSGDVLRFYWRDPAPRGSKPIHVQVGQDAWAHYYGPAVHAIVESQRRAGAETHLGDFYLIEGADLGLSLHPIVAPFLRRGEWGAAHEAADEAAETIDKDGYQPDGLAVRVGDSWRERFKELESNDGR
jgi:hypothetical protein